MPSRNVTDDDRADGAHPAAAVREALGRIASLRGVTRLDVPAGQVVFYAGHVPPGAFVMLAGAAVLESPLDRRRRRTVRAGMDAPVVLPGLEHVDAVAPDTVIIAEAARFLYVPRSVLLHDPAVRAQLAAVAGWAVAEAAGQPAEPASGQSTRVGRWSRRRSPSGDSRR